MAAAAAVASGRRRSRPGRGLAAHSGDVKLQLPAGTALRVEAETFSGDIRSAFGGEVERGHGPGAKLRHETDGAGVRVEAATFSDNVELSEID